MPDKPKPADTGADSAPADTAPVAEPTFVSRKTADGVRVDGTFPDPDLGEVSLSATAETAAKAKAAVQAAYNGMKGAANA